MHFSQVFQVKYIVRHVIETCILERHVFSCWSILLRLNDIIYSRWRFYYIFHNVITEYVQPSFDSDDDICCMDVFVTLVESPASFYIQFIGEEYSVSYVL